MATSRVTQNLGKANTEAKGRYLGDLARRKSAAGILNPNEVSGDYDAARLLATTLGGEMRAITHEDLKAFRRSVETLGKKYRGGITAKSVIDMSLPIDRQRANREINVAVPVQYKGGMIHFVTNASPDSDVKRHHLLIELMDYNAALASPAKSADLAKSIVDGRLKFQCDCGRFTFWYRYIATVGGFVAGRPETGFPKVRNPKLVGVACKHLLRCLQQLSSPMVRGKVRDMIETGRGALEPKRKVLTKAQADEIAQAQQKQAGYKRNLIESAAEKRDRLARQRAVQRVVERNNTNLSKMSPAQMQAEVKKFEMNARKLAAMGVLSPAQLKKLMGSIKGN